MICLRHEVCHKHTVSGRIVRQNIMPEGQFMAKPIHEMQSQFMHEVQFIKKDRESV